MNIFRFTAAITVATLAAGCASNSNEIKAAYVSPLTYDGYTCEQLVRENERLQARIGAAAGDVDKKAQSDKVKMGVGLVLFWPTLFFLKGDGAEAQEYSRLKGEHEAIKATYVRKDCANTPAQNVIP